MLRWFFVCCLRITHASCTAEWHSPAVRLFVISSDQVRWGGAVALSEAVATSTGLRSLVLRKNNIGTAAGLQMGIALARKSDSACLVDIQVRYNRVKLDAMPTRARLRYVFCLSGSSGALISHASRAEGKVVARWFSTTCLSRSSRGKLPLAAICTLRGFRVLLGRCLDNHDDN